MLKQRKFIKGVDDHAACADPTVRVVIANDKVHREVVIIIRLHQLRIVIGMFIASLQAVYLVADTIVNAFAFMCVAKYYIIIIIEHFPVSYVIIVVMF